MIFLLNIILLLAMVALLLIQIWDEYVIKKSNRWKEQILSKALETSERRRALAEMLVKTTKKK